MRTIGVFKFELAEQSAGLTTRTRVGTHMPAELAHGLDQRLVERLDEISLAAQPRAHFDIGPGVACGHH